MKYFLKTTYPCLVKSDTSTFELEENDTLEIEDENIIFIYPESGKIPFYINLNNPKENDKFSIVNVNNRKVILLETPSRLKLEQTEVLNFSGKNCNITICENSLTFENDSKKITYFCPHTCKNYKVFKLKEFACIQFEEHLYAYNTTKNKLSHFFGESLQIENDKLTVSRQFCDSDNRHRNATYKFEGDIVLEKEEFLRNHCNTPAELLPYRLLESVRAKDFEFALDCLADNLRQQIDSNQITEFFGNISAFLPLSTTEYITVDGNKKNFVRFSLKGDKIDDILIDSL